MLFSLKAPRNYSKILTGLARILTQPIKDLSKNTSVPAAFVASISLKILITCYFSVQSKSNFWVSPNPL